MHPDAELELGKLPAREQVAVLHAMEKLQVLGPALGYPHSSDVKGADRLRELRPRAGRSPCRAFYRQFGRSFIIGAVGSEAEADLRGFRRAVSMAVQRLGEVEDQE